MNACRQTELESIQGQFEKTDLKANTLAKQVATLEQQLNEAAENIQEETKQKLAAQLRLKKMEEDLAASKEQLDDEEESRKSFEAKILQLTTQVIKHWIYFNFWIYRLVIIKLAYSQGLCLI